MRQILVDWMVDVHQSFELRAETLFLAFKYLEEFQSKVPIRKEDYQLVGTACLWVASKYEEIYPPRMKDFVEVTACTYSRAQLKSMEGLII
jgi:cyclin-A